MASLKEEYRNEISFIIADVDEPEGQQLADEFGIHHIPAFLYLEDSGELVGEDTGFQSKNHLRQRIESLYP